MPRIARLAVPLLLAALFVMAAPATAFAVNADLKVGVIKSEITYYGPNGGIYYYSRADAVTNMLRDHYDSVAQVGDDELCNADRLAQYDVLVAPRTLALSTTQRQALRTYVSRGGGFVSMFGQGRWDFQGFSSGNRIYKALIHVWQFSSSWDYSRSFEWGELSEMLGVKFNDDPYVGAGWGVVSSTSNHPILKAVSSGPFAITSNVAEYNEYVFTMKNNKYLVPLLYYRNAGSKSGSLAGWATSYYRGRVVAYPFQIYDGLWKSGWTNSSGTQLAESLIVNSVDWAAMAHTAVDPFKRVSISGNGWFTKGKLWINQNVYNCGSVQVRGPYKLELYDPANRKVWSGTAKGGEHVPLPAAASWKLGAWQIYLGSNHKPGRWRARMFYQYYDQLAGGWCVAYRDLTMSSTGKAMSQVGMSTQVNPTLSWSRIRQD